eukprot:352306-Pleurochrysis_carterae.AAC.2
MHASSPFNIAEASCLAMSAWCINPLEPSPVSIHTPASMPSSEIGSRPARGTYPKWVRGGMARTPAWHPTTGSVAAGGKKVPTASRSCASAAGWSGARCARLASSYSNVAPTNSRLPSLPRMGMTYLSHKRVADNALRLETCVEF